MKIIIFLTLGSFLASTLLAQNVGIGTANPLMRVHVAKTDSAVALFENTQALTLNTSTGMYFKTGNGLTSYTGAIKTIGESASAARLGLFTYAAAIPNGLRERLSILDNGKTGIGTISPLMNLHVVSTDSAVALLENSQTLNTNVSNGLYFKTGNGSLPFTGAVKTIGESAGLARLGLFTYTASSTNGLRERMSISDAGYVGIGTVTPTSALDVHGGLTLPIKVVTGNYTVQTGDYTIVVDMQNNVNKPEVKIFLPGSTSNTGRIINVVTINMETDDNSPLPNGGTNIVSIWDATGTTMFQRLVKWERYESNAGGYVNVVRDVGAVFQCLNATTWVTLSRDAFTYRFKN